MRFNKHNDLVENVVAFKKFLCEQCFLSLDIEEDDAITTIELFKRAPVSGKVEIIWCCALTSIRSHWFETRQES